MPAPTSHLATQQSPADRVTPGRSTAAACADHVVVLTEPGVAEVLAAWDAERDATLPLLGMGRSDLPLPSPGHKPALHVEAVDTDGGDAVIRSIRTQADTRY